LQCFTQQIIRPERAVESTQNCMAQEHNNKKTDQFARAFLYPYVVLAIMILLSIGATLVFFQNSIIFDDETVTRWTPVIFVIGLCISLLIFGMTHRDATARVALQRKTDDLLAAQKQIQALLAAEQASRVAAEQANRAKDEFLAVVSHELKTPLHAIAGWVRILRTNGISEETRETAIKKIEKNLRIQAGIVEEVLKFSDVMSSSAAPDQKSIAIRDVFERAVAAVSVAAFQKGITLANEDELGNELVLGDSEGLQTALVNILSNAVKFTPAGGNIQAKAFRSNGHVKCVIADTGPGIAPDFLPHVFEQYKQYEKLSTRSYGGLGLGLTIANHIVKLHHGTIDVESAGAGYGSTFTISIPVRG
jgi:signal transduction histidine kinase